jgi:two-component system CheB/CheR fusion protein
MFLDNALIVRSFTPAAASIFRLIASDGGRPLTDMASDLEPFDLEGDIRSVIESGEPSQRSVSRADGSKHYLMRVLPYRTSHQRSQGVVLTFVDVTGIVEAETRQRILVSELNHRVRNMLGVVTAVVNQTLETSGSPEHFAQAFQGRIQAMARSYTLVSKQQWSAVSLRDLIHIELEPYRNARNDIVARGPPVEVWPPAALALGLVFHELATNAVKYGALSAPTGKLSVSWQEKDGQLIVKWRESGGDVDPMREDGFGTTLIKQEMLSLDGSVALDFGGDGLLATLKIPTDSLGKQN